MSGNARHASDLKQLLRSVASGRLSPDEAEEALRENQLKDLGFAMIDLQRMARRGRPEVIYCERKTADQIISIANKMAEAGQNVLMTRMSDEQFPIVEKAFTGRNFVSNERSKIAHLVVQKAPRKETLVAVLAAGTSDLPVAEEAAFTAEALGSRVECAFDVGVAGLHRLLSRADLLVRAKVIIAVAGMEGALPGVVSGLVRAPVIAVPTSVGYGANMGGIAALLTMINGCSPGVSVVNIDNGFAAGYLADSIAELGEKSSATERNG